MRNISISQILIVIVIFIFLFTDLKKLKKEFKKYQSVKEYSKKKDGSSRNNAK